MSRINTNIPSLVAQHNLLTSQADLNTRLERLSTGLRINKGADDPAGLIVSERLRSEITGVRTALSNAERASNVIATTEAALDEVSSLLNSLRGLTVEAANTGAFSKEEIEANQLQLDSAIESIKRISNTTSFAGLKLLNGSLDYLTSGQNPAAIQDVNIFGASFGTASFIPVTVEVLNSAESGQLFISGGGAGTFLSSVSFEVQGNKGVQVFSFVSGTTLSAVTFAVNQVADATGVSASLVNPANQASGMLLTSGKLGSDQFVSVRKISGGSFFQTLDAPGGGGVNRDTGEDVLSLVNGNLALGNGTEISLRTATINVQMNLTSLAAQALSTYEFSVTGGGAKYQVGATVSTAEQIGFGIQSVAPSRLGNEAVGFLNELVSGGSKTLTAGKAREAQDVISVAIDQISRLRGRLGALERNTLQTTIRSQQISLENLTASESSIRDADFAAETAALTRAQILNQAGISTLALANSTSQNVLALLQ